ncbi:hypothetical protein HY947_05095 [Candidatus Gottesmanbacteria bacterium]|nr:hypothetical protein [Candidatus Gottesmanbacteria bacterium]
MDTPSQDESTQAMPQAPSAPLIYEETPVVSEEPSAIADTSSPQQQVSKPPDTQSIPQTSKRNGIGSFFAKIFGFIFLFLLGIGLSVLLRQYLPTKTPSLSESLPTEDVVKATPTVAEQNIDPLASWKTFSVVSGVTRLPLDSLTFKLPPDVLSPICDGTTCASQGTYLPGGTRFTVAPRGQGQLLSDFRGKIVSDLAGKSFSVKQATISGKSATEFTGSFTGSTAGGYAFSRMRGVMIEASPTLSLEINHFVPSGISANFDSDDTLFDTILTTLSFSTLVNPIETQTLSPSLTPSTSSGTTQ